MQGLSLMEPDCDSECLHPWSQLDCPLTVQDARTHGTRSGHASVDVDAQSDVHPIRGPVGTESPDRCAQG
jgi:hypothetical protein